MAAETYTDTVKYQSQFGGHALLRSPLPVISLPWGLQLARKAYYKLPRRHKKHVVAVYIEGNKIVIHSNDIKTSPVAKMYGSRWERIHAEHCVLRGVDDASKGKLFVYRETKDGNIALARPCQFCLPFLRDKKIRKVCYTTSTGYAWETIL